MACKLVTSQQRTTLPDDTPTTTSPCQLFQSLKPELRRLASFQTWTNDIHPNISKGLLAKAGFTYTGKNEKVRCETCGLEIESWTPDMDPNREHMEQSSQCQFVLENSDLFPKNGLLFVCYEE
jgi:hypothetical protein